MAARNEKEKERKRNGKRLKICPAQFSAQTFPNRINKF